MPLYLPLVEETPEWHKCIESISNGLGISNVMARLLVNRGIRDLEQATSFIDPSLNKLHDPFLLPDMAKAVDRIQQAIDHRQRIAIYGDYDVDGITAASVLYLFLKNRGAEVEVYIPDRYSEGYGMNCQAVKQLCDGGVKLIITVDCGITAIKEVKLARELGVDVIVTDHHQCSGELPDACAVINPSRGDHSYPFCSLAGVGVAAKLIQAMGGIEAVEEYLDLIALGTVADVVPLVDENRILAAKGIERMNISPRLGVEKLIRVAGLAQGSIDAYKIAFMLAPRLNAAGRMATAYLGFSLLTTHDEEKASSIARQLNEENSRRQRIENALVEECIDRVIKNGDLSTEWIIVLEGEEGEGWHPGVIGIAASKISELFYRPCILISLQGDTGVGSARSIEGFDIYNALKHVDDLFLRFGGHEMAAGFSILREAIPELKRRLLNYAHRTMDELLLIPRDYHDGLLTPQDITLSLVQELKRLEPFGMGNPPPKFLFCNAQVESCWAVGDDGKHLKMAISTGQRLWDAIGFGLGDKKDYLLGKRNKVDIIAAVEENEWGGVKKVQLNVKSMQNVINSRNDVEAFLEPFYFKFFDAFLQEIMYNNDCINTSQLSKVWELAFQQLGYEEAIRRFKASKVGNLILASTLEGAQWALNLIVQEEMPHTAFAYGYFHEMWETGINGILLAPLIDRVLFRHYRSIFLLEGELPLYPRLFSMEGLSEKVYIIKGWNSQGVLLKRVLERLKVERMHFVALYKWLYSQRSGQNLWPGLSRMVWQFNQATGQDINEFQMRLMLGVFKELDFVRIDSQQAYVKVECVQNPRSRELTESVLYQKYRVWIEGLQSHCEKEE
ncbi:single-stranded-DNA-specific exonuclease [Caldicoprobacter guelmensis]|uniref:single-stranded-DNA-specific exonuclease RecJ n=1 Tax=Caldicoprobacter guelmensis TaxID=1170224 RepID=UPI001958FEC7|nr:single-stranded-DNA-specific exonuclease RecJ [Caldicoprobacter guelmensis]MBM7582300.1 single-stranded-DNA-specific exonuclease [Caldicoprobacter guelmensis]